MNNEEKALEIQHNDPCCVWNDGCPNVRNGAMEMAQWKDEQFKQILQVIYSKTLSIEKDVIIEQIYKELFREDLDRNELEKDELKNILEKLKNVEL